MVYMCVHVWDKCDFLSGIEVLRFVEINNSVW